MELTACQLDEIRAKQREDEAVRRLSTQAGHVLGFDAATTHRTSGTAGESGSERGIEPG